MKYSSTFLGIALLAAHSMAAPLTARQGSTVSIHVNLVSATTSTSEAVSFSLNELASANLFTGSGIDTATVLTLTATPQDDSVNCQAYMDGNTYQSPFSMLEPLVLATPDDNAAIDGFLCWTAFSNGITSSAPETTVGTATVTIISSSSSPPLDLGPSGGL